MTAAGAWAPLVGQQGLEINKGDIAVDSTSAPDDTLARDFDIASSPPPDNASAHFLNRATGIAQGSRLATSPLPPPTLLAIVSTAALAADLDSGVGAGVVTLC